MTTDTQTGRTAAVESVPSRFSDKCHRYQHAALLYIWDEQGTSVGRMSASIASRNRCGTRHNIHNGCTYELCVASIPALGAGVARKRRDSANSCCTYILALGAHAHRRSVGLNSLCCLVSATKKKPMFCQKHTFCPQCILVFLGPPGAPPLDKNINV